MAIYLGIWELNENGQWIGDFPRLIAFVVATIVEISAHFIPWADSLMDFSAIPLARVAGIVVVVSTAANLKPVAAWWPATVAGGGTATVIKRANAAGRFAPSSTTGEIVNSVVFSVETGTAAAVSMASILAPPIAAIPVIVILAMIFRIYRKNAQTKKTRFP